MRSVELGQQFFDRLVTGPCAPQNHGIHLTRRLTKSLVDGAEALRFRHRISPRANCNLGPGHRLEDLVPIDARAYPACLDKPRFAIGLEVNVSAALRKVARLHRGGDSAQYVNHRPRSSGPPRHPPTLQMTTTVDTNKPSVKAARSHPATPPRPTRPARPPVSATSRPPPCRAPSPFHPGTSLPWRPGSGRVPAARPCGTT